MLGIKLNLPNSITLFRIVLIPIFILAFLFKPYPYHPIVLCSLFFLASISDWIDGYLARRLQQESAFGAFLDPVADKLMVTTAMVLLVFSHSEILMVLPAIVIVGRELTVSALREWMAGLGEREKVKVNVIGKLKTVSQLWAIGFLLYDEPIGQFEPTIVGYVLLYIATVLTLWSMVVYVQAAWPSMSNPEDER